jgi:hypothetical protein
MEPDISAMAASQAAELAAEGCAKPLTLRTNWRAAASISFAVAGGSKLNSGRIFRHIACSSHLSGHLWHSTGRRQFRPGVTVPYNSIPAPSLVGIHLPDDARIYCDRRWPHLPLSVRRRIAFPK